jgi:hypothetical protein
VSRALVPFQALPCWKVFVDSVCGPCLLYWQMEQLPLGWATHVDTSSLVSARPTTVGYEYMTINGMSVYELA